MFENFKSITIEGGYFENPTTLNLFKKSPANLKNSVDNQMTVIYNKDTT